MSILYGEVCRFPRSRFHPRLRLPLVQDIADDRAKQSFKDECDINRIMRGYVKGSSIEHYVRHGASYGDFSPLSFHEAMNSYIKVNEMFEDLPAAVRKRFNQDPKGFLEFVQARDDKGNLVNLEEMRKLKLAPPPVAPAAPVSVSVANAADIRGGPGAQPPAP